ncbi:thiamine pyrophosphate-dependent dehydrogenase E1 component subunit alpha [Streptomyces sp. 5.8]|uniref:thiamine pyrophosphate-dependent dehydrogenase E1 component subunit alpha n=1 Tax=Streptomyces sp. 5.8 TaxID=3406571 RepID=UPI003BB6F2C7
MTDATLTETAPFTATLPEDLRQVLNGRPAPGSATSLGRIPEAEELRELYRAMLLGRAVEDAATAMAKQGLMAVYPAARGQEACQVGAAAALKRPDWLFPTYRDSIAVISRGAEPAEVLAGPIGRRHLGYDPYEQRTAPLCTPLATHAPHAVGFAHAARYRGENTVALVLLGEGATSEGDFHAALTFAAAYQAPVVFVVQNNGYAISTPARLQSAAPSFAHKGIGYGVPAERVDGNDVLAVLMTARAAVERARAGAGPALIEALTYRIGPHTSSDDPTRYRPAAEPEPWKDKDPLHQYAAYLHDHGILTPEYLEGSARAAQAAVRKLRLYAEEPFVPDPADITAHVYAEPPSHLLAQTAALLTEGSGDD